MGVRWWTTGGLYPGRRGRRRRESFILFSPFSLFLLALLCAFLPEELRPRSQVALLWLTPQPTFLWPSRSLNHSRLLSWLVKSWRNFAKCSQPLTELSYRPCLLRTRGTRRPLSILSFRWVPSSFYWLILLGGPSYGVFLFFGKTVVFAEWS